MRKLLPFLWLIGLYGVTVLVESHDPTPIQTPARLAFEARHVLAHLFAFGLEIWLVASAVSLPASRPDRAFWLLVSLGTFLGIGLEVIQASLRPEILWLDSGWDVLVDAGGAAAGWWVYQRRLRVRLTSASR